MLCHNRGRFIQAASTVIKCGGKSLAESRQLSSSDSRRMNSSKFTRKYTNSNSFFRRCLYRLDTARGYLCVKTDGQAGAEVVAEVVSGPADLSVEAPSSEFLSKLDEQSQRHVHIIRMEMEVLRGSGVTLPDQLSESHWEKFLDMRERWQRVQLYNYLKTTELKAKNDSMEKGKIRKEAIEKSLLRAELPYNELEYALDRNNIMPLVTFSQMKAVCDVRLCQAMIHGPKVVVDLGFTEYMDEAESSLCVRRLSFMLGYNRISREPFDVYLCNVRPGNFVYKKLLNAYPNLHSKEILLNVTDQSYLDLFPKESLAYLSPDSHLDMVKFNCESVYILGGLENRGRVGRITLAKAKREGIRSVRLPIHTHLKWGQNMCLPIHTVFKILLDIKNTRDWHKAFKHITKPTHNEGSL